MTTQFLQDQLWSDITKQVKAVQRDHSYVAVAYIGNRAADLLPLKHDDVLVTDLSEATVMAGQVNPHEIVKFLKLGVRVYTTRRLHAKVFVLGRVAIIGSANASSNSSNYLIEAAVKTTDTHIVQAARMFIQSIAVEEISLPHAQELAKRYVPPKFTPASKAETPRIWITYFVSRYESELEAQVRLKLKRQAEKQFKAEDRFQMEDYFAYTNNGVGKNVKTGDYLIPIFIKNNGFVAYPPSRIFCIKPYQNPKNNSKRLYLYVEQPTDQDPIAWNQLARVLRKHHIQTPPKSIDRAIRDEVMQRDIRALWPSP